MGKANTTPPAKFRRLYQNEELTLRQIADQCGYVNAGSVIDKADTLGLPRRKVGPGRRPKVCRDTAPVLFALGVSQRDIAIHFKCTQQAVSRVLRRKPCALRPPNS